MIPLHQSLTHTMLRRYRRALQEIHGVLLLGKALEHPEVSAVLLAEIQEIVDTVLAPGVTQDPGAPSGEPSP